MSTATESRSIRRAIALHDAALSALDSGDLNDARSLATKALDTAIAACGLHSRDLTNRVLTGEVLEEPAGDFQTAEELAGRAAELAAELVSTDDPALMSLRVYIEVAAARLTSTLGDVIAQKARLSAALLAANRIVGPEDERVLEIHNVRRIAAEHACRFDEAEVHYRRTRAIPETQPVVESRVFAGLLHNLGGLDHSRGRVAQGLAHAKRGVQVRVEAVGPDHPDVARDLNIIGALHHDAGDADAANDAYRRALDIYERTLGADHYKTGMTCANLAVSTAAAGNGAEARWLYGRALRILERSVGAQHPDVALVQHNLAVLLADQGDLDGAMVLLSEAQDSLAASLPQDHQRSIDLRATVTELSTRSCEL